jgi:rubredoxin
MEKYKCVICGYVYDQEEGDFSGGIEPGVPFDNLPPDYICPICGMNSLLLVNIGLF